MGVVYAAFDPDLGRRVALKILHAEAGSGSGDSATLLREARALARLSHPHVVTVYDVGMEGADVFIAMELMEGGSLREWLARKPPREKPRAIAQVFLEAALGLAAAHRAGLVHRDFKPDNVLLTSEGTAKVGDFGLARVPQRQEPGVSEGVAPSPSLQSLYRTGALVGTPAYMSPEQRLGRPADERSDQYAFAVALHEALTGTRPGEGAEARGARRIPRWLHRTVERGLRDRPEDRFPGMQALAQALRRGLARPRRALVIGAAALLFALSLVAALPRDSRELCTGAAEAWGQAWDEGAAAEVRAAFLATGRPTAATLFAAVEKALDEHKTRWIGLHTEACRATRVQGTDSEALYDLRLRCLAQRRQEAQALVRALRKADASAVDKAGERGKRAPARRNLLQREGAAGPVSPPRRSGAPRRDRRAGAGDRRGAHRADPRPHPARAHARQGHRWAGPAHRLSADHRGRVPCLGARPAL
jgi:serine/threonine protein kinase